MIEIYLEVQCLILSLIMLVGLHEERFSNTKARKILICLMSLVVLTSIFYLMKSCGAGHVSVASRWCVRIGEFGVNAIQYIQLVMLTILVKQIDEFRHVQVSSHWCMITGVIAVMEEAALVMNLFNGKVYWFDAQNRYHQGEWFLWTCILAAMGLLCGIIHVLNWSKYYSRSERIALHLMYESMILFVVLENFVGHSLTIVGEIIAMIGLYGMAVHEERMGFLRRGKVLLQTRAYLQNSQVNPHFIYNSLSIIQGLIDEDPYLAEEAIGHLAKFYRKDLNLKMQEELISVKDELQYVKDYLYMEGLRFEEDLNVHYEIDESLDFGIPFLSIQPLVENAVNHGIRKRAEIGNITIRIFRRDNQHVVEVEDDGSGFDVAEWKKRQERSDSVNSKGLFSVWERIRILCEGEMDLESEPGSGTMIRLRIPVKERG